MGNRENIKIWQPWLPRKHPPQVLSHPIESMENSTVAELINETIRLWNDELIDGVFTCKEAAMIKRIPLGKVASEDVLIWPHTHDGRYTCKSGYRFLKEETKLYSTQQHSLLNSKLWKGLWSLQVPNKVKNLMWRACRNAMPTKANLVRKKIIDDPICDRYHGAHEIALHAIWLCKEVDVIWADPELWSCRSYYLG
ncbi:hypothetical protein SO802_026698 [Lithocarpus litseifolius]|uniref:Reverse transcriptase zinc-binding domain-containing protein n=1 Tax=Lithocarpus litseifolius TaxID=425828 RepID=A0AAW2C2H6_9ROSI